MPHGAGCVPVHAHGECAKDPRAREPLFQHREEQLRRRQGPMNVRRALRSWQARCPEKVRDRTRPRTSSTRCPTHSCTRGPSAAGAGGLRRREYLARLRRQEAARFRLLCLIAALNRAADGFFGQGFGAEVKVTYVGNATTLATPWFRLLQERLSLNLSSGFDCAAPPHAVLPALMWLRYGSPARPCHIFCNTRASRNTSRHVASRRSASARSRIKVFRQFCAPAVQSSSRPKSFV